MLLRSSTQKLGLGGFLRSGLRTPVACGDETRLSGLQLGKRLETAPLVVGVFDPLIQNTAQSDERFLRVGPVGLGEVVELPRVAAHVVEFRLRHRGLAEDLLRGCELSLRVQFRQKRPYGILLHFVFVEREERDPRREIVDVTIALVAHGAQAHHRHVAAVAMAENVALIGFAMLAEEHVSLHFLRLRDARDGEGRRAEINALQHPLVHTAGLEMRGRGDGFRVLNDERHEEPFLVAELLSTHMRLSIIAEENDDRIVCETIRFQRLDDRADFAVQLRCSVEILSPVLTRDFVVGIVGRNLHLRRVGVFRCFIHAMRFVEIHLRIKRLMRFQVAPLGGVERLFRREEVPVGFAGALESTRRRHLDEIGGEVSRIAQPAGERTHAVGQCLFVLSAMILCADGCRIHAGH